MYIILGMCISNFCMYVCIYVCNTFICAYACIYNICMRLYSIHACTCIGLECGSHSICFVCFYSSRANRFAMTFQAHALLEQIGVCVRNNEPVLLVGETGTGKTSIVQYMADLMGLYPFFIIIIIIIIFICNEINFSFPMVHTISSDLTEFLMSKSYFHRCYCFFKCH